MQITLKAARVNAGLTQTEAADALNINRRTIVRWEQGKPKPTGKKLERLCTLYGINAKQIKE